MNTHAEKTQENKSQAVSAVDSQIQGGGESTFQFVDNRPEAIAQRKLQEMANNSAQVSQLKAFQDRVNNSQQAKQTVQLHSMADNYSSQQQQPIQKKENNTGLPDNLKTGMENLSGMSLDDVKVHRNSDKPEQLQAHAYAQGTDIHLASGQEKHLPHEAWHVVQQKQGRVKPTMQMKGKVNVNDDAGLEKEADVMGEKALQLKGFPQNNLVNREFANDLQLKSAAQVGSKTLQRAIYADMAAMWGATAPTQALANVLNIIQGNGELNTAYTQMLPSLPFMNFVQQNGQQPEASLQPNANGEYDIIYGPQATQLGDFADDNRFAGAIIHEMMHIHTALTYNTNTPAGFAHGANMHLPAPAPGDAVHLPMGVTDGQYNDPGGIAEQVYQMDQNWEQARQDVVLDLQNADITQDQYNLFISRIDYAEGIVPFAHYDTVLVDVLYYMVDHGLQATRFYDYATRMLAEANVRRVAGVGAVVAIPPAALPAPAPPGGGWCYITTACAQHQGLDDNCEELTVLRDFRDNYLMKKKKGKELIKLYYDYAPLILENIKKSSEEEEILARLYRMIKICVDSIKRGDNEFAYTTYCKMVVELKDEFIPDLKISSVY
jgi:hypothetical protein